MVGTKHMIAVTILSKRGSLSADFEKQVTNFNELMLFQGDTWGIFWLSKVFRGSL